MRRTRLVLVLTMLAIAVVTGAPPASATASSKAAIKAGRYAYADVNVMVVWGSTDAPRGVDQPALENPARIKTWLRNMSTSQRRALGPKRVNTQALYGTRVLVESVNGSWAKIAVPDQKSPWDSRGYPGWVPVRQLRQVNPPSFSTLATVVAKTTTLRDASGKVILELSYGTQLPFLLKSGSKIKVWTPEGRSLYLSTSDVVVHAKNFPARAKTATSIIADAKRFLGLAYIWDGGSAWGFDCSGITYLVYRTHGVLLPRDSFSQAKVGSAVSRSHLRAGDLVFLAAKGKVHHVGIYIGHNKILHAPKTGSSVEIVSMTGQWDAEYSGARRFL
ncbi:MAG: C40 family peptidase [Actinomycetota bacterium]